ncbi:MAG: hypothetical protein R3189_08515 [Thiomicrorhabdus chilensis]|uniref:hypothetical protein n=1 Tax=Thiomicrorhabdus chilensis TaxID=63656 RepID=UPI00299DB246|nr:hypothetical protein [Thiomicrorhabdus chilensis]MDX1348274.1 hypothetical protein [Thiomicrorhabdus chilensis]
MKILDQNLQLSAQHYTRTESRIQRIHETFVDGMLNNRTTETATSKTESMSLFEQHSSQRSSHNKEENSRSASSLNDKLGRPDKQDDRQLTRLSEYFKSMPQNSSHNGKTNVMDNQGVANAPSLPPGLIKMIEAIESLMEKMTGKPYHLKVYGYEPRDTDSAGSLPVEAPDLRQPEIGGFQRPTNQASVLGERWQLLSTYHEQEQSAFQALGHVKTADGKEIKFDLNMQMSRSFSTQVTVEREKGLVLKDPLTVNFGGSPASLTLEKVQFDIDADGQKDSVSFVQPGSGFLALDKNHDGLVNDGQELFGTQSGNGFADLALYDDDGNGWIDENDAVFSQLQIWHKDANGLDHLQGLMELNIGAIALQNLASPFSHKDPSNQLQGQVVSSGVFLYEDGKGAGSVQQIDLAV